MTKTPTADRVSRFMWVDSDVEIKPKAVVVLKYSEAQPRDEHGRFGSSGELEEHLVNYKPDRSLTGPGATHISNVVSGAKTTTYLKIPGINQLHEAMQQRDPTLGRISTSTDMEKYTAARDAVMSEQPIEHIPMDQLVYTQANVNTDRVKDISNLPAQLNKPVDVVRSGDKYYVLNGHHRVAGASYSGRGTITAHVFSTTTKKADSSTTIVITRKMADRIQKYSEDQPRDERGRFGSGDGAEIKTPDPATWNRKESGDTQTLYTKNGVYNKDRQELHDKQIAAVIDRVPVSSNHPPIYYMKGGGPAAGKSTLEESGKVSIPGPDQAAVIDADSFKMGDAERGIPAIPEFQQMVDAGNVKNAADVVHEESSDVTKMALAAAAAKGTDIVLDGTGDSKYSSLEAKVAQAREAGMRVEATYVTCPTQDAIDRAQLRGASTGRLPAEKVIRDTHASVSRVFPEAIKNNLFDKATLYNTAERGNPRLILSQENGVTTIHDQALWDEFLAKGSE